MFVIPSYDSRKIAIRTGEPTFAPETGLAISKRKRMKTLFTALNRPKPPPEVQQKWYQVQ